MKILIYFSIAVLSVSCSKSQNKPHIPSKECQQLYMNGISYNEMSLREPDDNQSSDSALNYYYKAVQCDKNFYQPYETAIKLLQYKHDFKRMINWLNLIIAQFGENSSHKYYYHYMKGIAYERLYKQDSANVSYKKTRILCLELLKNKQLYEISHKNPDYEFSLIQIEMIVEILYSIDTKQGQEYLEKCLKSYPSAQAFLKLKKDIADGVDFKSKYVRPHPNQQVPDTD